MDDVDFIARLTTDAAFHEGGAAGLAAGSADVNPTLKFFDNLRRATLASLDFAGGDDQLPTVFVLSDKAPRTDARKVSSSATRLVDINLRRPAEWAGKLVFTAPHGTGGWCMPLPQNSVDVALDVLEQNDFGHLPAAIIYPERRALSCYQEGGASVSAPINLDLPAASRQVTIADIFDVLEDIRRKSLLTPQIGPPNFWADGPTYEPGPEAERTIQWIVAAQLRSAFRPLEVDMEQEISLGRMDVLMTDPNRASGQFLHPAIIELKALKSRSHGGAPFAPSKNIKAVVKGMRQAKAYRMEKGAQYSVLGCFDLRKDKTDILAEKVCVMARNRYFTDDRVEAFVFPLYGRTEDAQEAAAIG
jgi:hypothetical protein